MSNFQTLEVVDRGSETQPQVVENLNKLTNNIHPTTKWMQYRAVF